MNKKSLTVMALAACLMAAPVAESTAAENTGVDMTLVGSKKTTKKKTTKKKTTKKTTTKKTTSTKKTTTAAATTAKVDSSKTTAKEAESTSSSTGLGSLIGGILGAASGNSTTGSIISGLSTIFNANKQATAEDLAGTWKYTEPAVVFTSENALSSIGGKMAAQAIEKQLQSKLEKYGIKKGAMKMTFDKDGNFTQTLAGKTLSGTYTIKNKQVVLSYGGTVKQIVGTTQVDGNDLLIVMDASKLLQYAKLLGTVSGSSTLQAASSLLNSVNGMKVGLKLNK
ncbi:MAG: DUF4923 family protein [Prevotella sp.]|nr:DUF4923 family protein [Prevotella sp.]